MASKVCMYGIAKQRPGGWWQAENAGVMPVGIVPVSAQEGTGLLELQAALWHLLAESSAAVEDPELAGRNVVSWS